MHLPRTSLLPGAPGRAGRTALALLIAAALSSCGDGEDKKGKDDTVLEKVKAQADELLASAKRLNLDKLASEEYAKAKKLYDEGAAALDEGDAKNAKKLRSAVTNLKRLVEEQEKVGERIKKLAEHRTAAEEAKKKADAAKAAENSAETYQEALAALKAGSIDKAANVKVADQAQRDLVKAKDLFDEARQRADENQTARARYEEEKKVMLKQKAMAREAGAEEKAAAEWVSAGQAERDAEASLGSNPMVAIEQMRQATSQYQRALESLKSAAEIAVMMKRGEEEGEKHRAEQLKLDEMRIEADKEKARHAAEAKVAAAKAKAAAAAAGKGGGSTTAAVALFDDFDPANYPQELSAEDEAFLTENVSKLSKAGVLTYDPETSAVYLDYTSGRDVQKDIDRSLVAKKEFLVYEDPITMGVKVKDEKDKKDLAAYSFSGNTEGTAFFPVPFRYYARMEFHVVIGVMDTAGTLGYLCMYDKRKQSGYMSQWLQVGTVRGASRRLKAPPKALVAGKPVSGSPDVWHTKFRQVPYYVEYRMPDPNPKEAAKGALESGLFTLTYDHDTTDAVTAKYADTIYKSGLVGFTWNRVKFQIIGLQITGILDKQAAVDYLRKTLKVKGDAVATKKKPAKKPKKPSAEEEGEGGGNGNGGSTGNGGEKPKKKPKKSETKEEGKKEGDDPFDF